MRTEGPFWRTIAVYRIASLAYAALLLAGAGGYQRPVLGWLVIGVMALWTVATTFAYSVARSRTLLVIDMLVTMGCLLASPYVQGPGAGPAGVMPVTATWIGGPVLAWAVHGGRRAGALAAIVLAAIVLAAIVLAAIVLAAIVLAVADLRLRGFRAFDLTVPLNGARLAVQTPPDDGPRLTDRETEVLRLVAKGLSYKQIAERLVLSHRTVQNHVQNTLNKLQLHNRVELVRYAIERGLDET
jgi:DNA-binding CsgD family transcriptional regulator